MGVLRGPTQGPWSRCLLVGEPPFVGREEPWALEVKGRPSARARPVPQSAPSPASPWLPREAGTPVWVPTLLHPQEGHSRASSISPSSALSPPCLPISFVLSFPPSLPSFPFSFQQIFIECLSHTTHYTGSWGWSVGQKRHEAPNPKVLLWCLEVKCLVAGARLPGSDICLCLLLATWTWPFLPESPYCQL